MLQTPLPRPQTDEVDVPRLTQPLRRHALPLLSAALLAGGLTYFLAAQQAPVYQTMSSVVAVNNGDDSLENEGLFAAPPLEPGVLQEALRDERVIEGIAGRVLASGLAPSQAQALAQAVRAQRDNTYFEMVSVTPQGSRSNLYEVWGSAGTPAAAQVLVNASVDALRAWDQQRAQERIALARTSLQRQLTALNRNEPDLEASDLRWDTFQATQAQLLRQLARAEVLAPAAVATLNVVARAPEPRRASGASPLRRAALAALLTLFAASAAVLLFEAWRRRVYDERGLRDLGLPLLGQLPPLGAGALQGGPLPESVGFLRVNVLSQLPEGAPRRLVFAGVQKAAGSSNAVTALAASLAAAGQRVLIVDGQNQGSQPQGAPLPGAGHHSPERPSAVPTRRVAEGVDLLPLGGTDPAHARATVERLGAGYDLTLIDSPPLLRRSDALLWGAGAAGLVLVLEPGASSTHEVERALQSAGLARVRVLGAVLSEQQPSGGTRQLSGGQRPLVEGGVHPGEVTAR